MTILEFSSEATMQREAVAKQLRRLADQLERHNNLEFHLDGIRYTVDVPDRVTFEVELELGDGRNELELEISW